MREVVGVALLEPAGCSPLAGLPPPSLAGCWELPGGKVEPGEDPSAAAVREIAEELGCGIEVTGWLEGESLIQASATPVRCLRVATARLVERRPGARRARRRALAARPTSSTR